jgi:hypothetical protein
MSLSEAIHTYILYFFPSHTITWRWLIVLAIVVGVVGVVMRVLGGAVAVVTITLFMGWHSYPISRYLYVPGQGSPKIPLFAETSHELWWPSHCFFTISKENLAEQPISCGKELV